MIIDHCRDEKELYDLYTLRPMPNQYDFEFLMNNPNLFCFYDKEQGYLKGFITIQRENIDPYDTSCHFPLKGADVDGKVLTLSGTAIRGIMPDIITAIITVCKAFNETIYSVTPLKHAGLVLKKAGFTKVSKNIYRRLK